MKGFTENLKKIYLENKAVLTLMGVVLVMALAFLIFSLVNLKTGSSVIKTGYADVGRYQGGAWSTMLNSGGYRDGSWEQMMMFPLFALIFGVMHNILAVKLFEKKHEGAAMIFLIVTILLIFVAFVVEIRLLGEG